MTPPPNTPLPGGYSEEEIRDLVGRVLDGVLAGQEVRAVPDPAVDDGVANPTPPATAIAIGADHGGYPLKERLAFRLREEGHEVIDCGTHSGDAVDYPDFAHDVARKVAGGEARWGIVVDGAGIGSAMVANKVPGVRAALCYDVSTARNSREHNHANVLTLGAGLVGDGLAWQIVQEWLAVDWGGGRHARRVEKITAVEQTYLRQEA
jgi:ribose 5-phosphate isomerase B